MTPINATHDTKASAVRMTREEKTVVFASSLGTTFEFYDFTLFGSLSTVLATKFFSSLDPSLAFIFTLVAFSVAYIVRPLGALIFGYVGDIVGRKYTFLITIMGMGFGTFLISLLPTYATWGLAAPILLMMLRVVQGISVGGEFGGAASYVAEYAPQGRLGFFTAWIQICASLGTVLSLFTIFGIRFLLGDSDFNEWGWRLPFALSLVLLGISMWIRLRLEESPIFQRMKAAGRTTKTPISDVYRNWKNVRIQLVLIFGPLAACQVVGVLALIYVLLFLLQTLKADGQTVSLLVGAGILAAIPVFPLMGWVSDRIGRKPVIIIACVLTALTTFPAMKALTHYANPEYERAAAISPLSVVADPDECSFQFNPTGAAKFLSSCDILRSAVTREGVSFKNVTDNESNVAELHIGQTVVKSFDGHSLSSAELADRSIDLTKQIKSALLAAGYPASADMAQFNKLVVWLIVFYITSLFATAQSSTAALLVELFPASIRYTAISVPYHLTAVIGGFLLPVGFAMSAVAGDIYFGLWYVVGWAAVGAVIYFFCLPETRNRPLQDWF